MTPVVRTPLFSSSTGIWLIRLFLGVVVTSLCYSSVAVSQELQATDSLGSVAGADAFGRIVDAARSDDGSIAVAQAGVGGVWVFSPNRELQVIGRDGQGPAEFTFPSYLHWRNGDLQVVDIRSRKIVTFGPDGRHIETTTIPPATTPGYQVYAQLADGSIVSAPGLSARFEGRTWPLIVYDPVNDAVEHVGVAHRRRVNATAILPSGQMLVLLHPMPNFTRTAVSPGGRFFGTADEAEAHRSAEGEARIRIAIYDTRGEASNFVVAVPTEPATRSDLLDRLSNLIAGYSEILPRDAVERSLIEGIPLPERLPALSRFMLDDRGNAWVGSEVAGRAAIWRVYNRGGDQIAVYRVPERMTLKKVYDGEALAIGWDEYVGGRIYVLPYGLPR